MKLCGLTQLFSQDWHTWESQYWHILGLGRPSFPGVTNDAYMLPISFLAKIIWLITDITSSWCTGMDVA